MNIFAMIPARFGSQRLKTKNLALLNGKPMISYAINAAKDAKIFDAVYLNSESEIFRSIADRYQVNFYHRPSELGASDSKIDAVVADFIRCFPKADIVVWVNPTSPLQTSEEVRNVVDYFIKNKLDSLITIESKQVHALCDNSPINYNTSEEFSKTQDLKPVDLFVYSIMIWRASTFIDEYNKNGHAIFCGKFGTYPVSKETGVIIKYQEDLLLVDSIMKNKHLSSSEVQYDSIFYEK